MVDVHDEFNSFSGLFIANIRYMALVWTSVERRVDLPLVSVQVSAEIVVLQADRPFDDSVLIGMLYWNYYLCVTTDPGRVPDGWVRRLI